MTTRFRAGVAVAFTALVLAQTVRGALTRGNVPDDWLLQDGFFFLHGWPTMWARIFFQAYIWWLGDTMALIAAVSLLIDHWRRPRRRSSDECVL